MDGPTIMRELIGRGYSPIQAAALAGHALQESGGDPTNVNAKEDAHGLLQWRLDRWDALKDFARERGVSPTNPGLQLDFIGRELTGSEARAGKGFLSAGDLPSASAALKPYIRFGDDSAQARLNNASGLLGTPGANAAAPIAGTNQPAPAGNPSPAPTAAQPTDPGTGIASALAAIPKQIAQQDTTPPPIQM